MDFQASFTKLVAVSCMCDSLHHSLRSRPRPHAPASPHNLPRHRPSSPQPTTVPPPSFQTRPAPSTELSA
eukprot:1617180-Pleurochrysis_carterae.AAC.1